MDSDNDTFTELTCVDEVWIADWAAEGIAALERYLARQAAFQAYLHNRDLHSGDGDGRARL